MPAISTCHAVRNAITATGASPLFIDTLEHLTIVYYSYITPYNPKIKEIISINHFGIIDLPKDFKKNIPVIEDSSQCFRLKSSKKNVICSISSLYFSKVLNSIDGGVIFSDSIIY